MTKPQSEIVSWWTYVRAVLLKPSWEFITTGVIATTLYVVTWWRDNTVPEEIVKKWDLRNFLPHLSPWIWLCIGLAVLLYLSIRASYELWKEQRAAIQLLTQPEPLPETAPQVALEAARRPRFDVTGWQDHIELVNISKTEALYNIVFQPQTDALQRRSLTWRRDTIAKLAPGENASLYPVLSLDNGDGQSRSYNGLADVLSASVDKQKTPEYDLGPIAFTCEDSRQNRYLVTFKILIRSSGNGVSVQDLDRRRIVSRPSTHTPQKD
jgi:hypothetical protein